jgi:predicted cupin superfamily sugar epimerase
VWHFYDGDPLELHILDEWEHRVVVLGRDLAAGQVPQCVVPAGLWQAAKPLGDRFTLAGCTVAPGFEWADFEMPGTDELLRTMPQHETVIRALSRSQRPPGMSAQ